jgi:tripartite-type tricarboxylate transporter receptor subunit TctC
MAPKRMIPARRVFVALLWGAAFGAAVASPPTAIAQDYPNRQVTLISPWPAGGAIDALCRIVGGKLADRLGKPVVVENKPGAGSVIGTAAGAKALPDGYTLTMGGGSGMASGVTYFKKLPYDPVRDFIPVALIAQIPFVLVTNPSLPVRSVAELVQYAKANPGTLSFGSGGPGSPHHLNAELFMSATGIKMTHVPYKGSAPAITDVVAGHIPLMFSDTVPALPLIRGGKVRALGVSSSVRLPSAPDIPTIAEAGIAGFDAASWGMVIVPAETPKDIVNRLYAEFKAIVALPDVQQQIVQIGMVPIPSPPPEELQPFLATEITRWGKVVRQAGVAGAE